MIEIISTEKQKITDQEAIEAMRTIRRYCKEHEDIGPECQGCCVNIIHRRYSAPEYWDLPGDEEDEKW